MLTSSLLGSQPSSTQVLLPTDFGLSTWLLMVLPYLMPIHLMYTFNTPCMRKKTRPNSWISCIETRSAQLIPLGKRPSTTTSLQLVFSSQQMLPKNSSPTLSIQQMAIWKQPQKIWNPSNHSCPYNMNPLLWRRGHLYLWRLPCKATSRIQEL